CPSPRHLPVAIARPASPVHTLPLHDALPISWWKRCRFHHGSGCSRGWDHDRARGFGSTQPQRLWLVRTDTRSAAVGEEFSRSPTCSLVPRKGSSVGTRCRESWPGRSKMTESQEAAATASAYLSKQRPRK